MITSPGSTSASSWMDTVMNWLAVLPDGKVSDVEESVKSFPAPWLAVPLTLKCTVASADGGVVITTSKSMV